MFHDIYNLLHLDPEPPFVVTREVLYADDSLLMSSSPRNLQALLNAVVAEGAKYGLELHWGKTYQMQVCTAASICKPNGEMIVSKREVVYLGSIISCDGKSEREVSRRICEGRNVFKVLSKLWCHANLTVHRKLQIFNACVLTKVLYALESLWLLKVEQRRLDAFQCYCLRQIMRIAPSFVSRISNVTVFERSHQTPLTALLKQRQIRCYKIVQASGQDDFVKQLVCNNHGVPINWYIHRKRGRPRQKWATSVFRLMSDAIVDPLVPFVPFFHPAADTWW